MQCDNARDALGRARIVLRQKVPYLMPLVHRVIVVFTEKIPTMAVNGKGHLFINPGWICTAPSDEVNAGVIAHEIMHIFFRHVSQCAAGELNPKIWNIATDLAINGLLINSGFELPEECQFPDKTVYSPLGTLPYGLSALEYYNRLAQAPDEGEQGQGEEGKDGEGQGEEQGEQDGEGGEEQRQGGQGEEQGEQDGEGWQNPLIDCQGGSGDGAPSAEGDDAEGDKIPAGLEECEIHSSVEECKRLLQQHAQQAGDLPEWARLWANVETKKPKINWRSILRQKGRRLTREAGRARISYARPNRRQECIGSGPGCPILPTMLATRCNILFAIDTSGSMYSEIADVASELVGAIGASCVIDAVCFDTEVKGDPLELPRSKSAVKKMLGDFLIGGGGTDFHDVFRVAEESKKYDLIVVATDGYGDSPKHSSIPTIWLITNDGHSSAEFGEVIKLEDAA